MAQARDGGVIGQVEMSKPEFGIGIQDSQCRHAAIDSGHDEVEMAGELHGVEIFLPLENHAVIAQAAGDIDHQLIRRHAAERPILAGEYVLDTVEGVADVVEKVDLFAHFIFSF